MLSKRRTSGETDGQTGSWAWLHAPCVPALVTGEDRLCSHLLCLPRWAKFPPLLFPSPWELPPLSGACKQTLTSSWHMPSLALVAPTGNENNGHCIPLSLHLDTRTMWVGGGSWKLRGLTAPLNGPCLLTHPPLPSREAGLVTSASQVTKPRAQSGKTFVQGYTATLRLTWDPGTTLSYVALDSLTHFSEPQFPPGESCTCPIVPCLCPVARVLSAPQSLCVSGSWCTVDARECRLNEQLCE